MNIKTKSLFILLLFFGALIAPFVVPTINSTPTISVDSKSKTIDLSKWGGLAKINVKSSDSNVQVIDRTDSTEYLWTLTEPPATNKFYLKMDYSGCTMYYQPALNTEVYPKGWTVTETDVWDDKGILVNHRDENVVGSFALYIDNLRDGVYTTGKVAHIYRPYAEDAKGNRVWCILSYVDGYLVTEVPQSWLNKAKYPVVVDPTFGYSTSGGSNLGGTTNYYYGYRFTSPAYSGTPTATKVSGYGSVTNAQHVKFCVWADGDAGSGGGNGAILATGSAVTGDGTLKLYESTISWTGPASSTVYVIGHVFDSAGSYMKYDTGTATYGKIDTTGSYATPDPFDWDVTTNDKKISVFVTYTDVGPVISSVLATDLDDTTNIYTAKKNYTATITITKGAGCIDIEKVTFKVMQGATLLFELKGDTLTGVPAWSEVVGSSNVELNAAGCSWVSGTGVATFSFKTTWSCPATAISTLYGSAVDTSAVNSTWVSGDTAYIVDRLVVSGLVGNATYVETTNWLQLNGTIFYALQQAGNAPSSSYPPDAQFTSVDIQDQYDVEWDTDATIVNGYFSVSFPIDGIGQTALFYPYCDMVAPYTDAKTADGRYWAVYLTAAPTDVWAAIFAYFGIVNPMPTINAAIANLSAFFISSLTNFVSFLHTTLDFLLYGVGSVVYWFGRLMTTVTDLLDTMHDILDGIYGGVNFFSVIWTTPVIEFVPIAVVLAWLLSLDPRSRNRGVSTLELAMADIQTLTWIIGYFISTFQTIFGFIIDLAFQFWGAIRG